MRTVIIAAPNKEYRGVMDNSLINSLDGTPLVWRGWAWDLKNAERACDPHNFHSMLCDTQSDLRHFFLGDTDETLATLIDKCLKQYGTNVVEHYSLPFKPLHEYDLRSITCIGKMREKKEYKTDNARSEIYDTRW